MGCVALFHGIRFKRHSIIIPWLLSYVAILLVPVMISMLTYSRTNQTIIDEINRSNNLILSKVQKDMDTLLEDMKRLSVEIAFNPQVQELLSIQESLAPDQYYTIYKAFESLKVFKSSNRSNDYFVYFKAIDTVITPDFSNTSTAVYNNLYAPNKGSYAEWMNRLSRYYSGEIISMGDGRKDASSTMNDLAYIRSIPIGKNGTSLGNVVIFLDQSKFWVNDGEDYLHNGVAVIIDSHDQVLASTNSMSPPLPVAYHDLSEKSGMVKARFEGQDLVVSYISSSTTDWKYMILMPEDVFWDKSEVIKRAMVISLIVCLIVGGALTYAFIRRNYSPVRMMMELFKDKKNRAGTEGKALNEYDFMHQAIHSTLLENTDMNSRLWRQKSFMRGHFIEKLLKGRERAIPLEQSLESYDLRFISDSFAVMVFNVEDYNDVSFQLIRFAVMNVTEELTGQVHRGFMTEMDEFLVCLINLQVKAHEEQDWKQELAAIASGVERFMQQHYHVPVTVSISSVHNSTIGISTAYYEAMEAMEYQNIYGVSGVMHYSDMEIPRAKGEYYYPLEKEQALMNCIKTGDYASAENIIDEVFKDNLEQRKLPLKIAKCLFVDLVSTMLKTINEISSIYDNSFLEELNPIERLLRSQTVSEMKQQLKDILRSFCDYIVQEQAGRRTKDTVQTIIDMVHSQYSDLNMSIASIADQIDLHPAYVSKLFKEGTGSSLLDYIGKFRIEQAKKIMREQDENMENVALLVGYSNVRTFRRVFAKYEGITPGKYSDMV